MVLRDVPMSKSLPFIGFGLGIDVASVIATMLELPLIGTVDLFDFIVQLQCVALSVVSGSGTCF